MRRTYFFFVSVLLVTSCDNKSSFNVRWMCLFCCVCLFFIFFSCLYIVTVAMHFMCFTELIASNFVVLIFVRLTFSHYNNNGNQSKTIPSYTTFWCLIHFLLYFAAYYGAAWSLYADTHIPTEWSVRILFSTPFYFCCCCCCNAIWHLVFNSLRFLPFVFAVFVFLIIFSITFTLHAFHCWFGWWFIWWFSLLLSVVLLEFYFCPTSVYARVDE